MTEVRATLDAWTQAIVASDVEAADRLLHVDYCLQSAGGVGDIDRATWLDNLVAIDTRSLEPAELDIREFGDVAVAVGRWLWDASMPGRVLTGEYAITDVLLRVGGRWEPRWRISIKTAE